MSYYQRLQYDVLTNKTAILPFFICDGDVLTLDIFVFDFAKGRLVNYFSEDVSGLSLEDISQRSALFIANKVHLETKDLIPSTAFSACIFDEQLSYFYRLYVHDKDYISSLDDQMKRRRYNLREIKSGLRSYLSTLNYNYCDQLRLNLEKEKPNRFTYRLKKREKVYPNLIKLMTHIDLYEDYQTKNYIDRDQMRNTLLHSNRILIEKSEDLISKKEARKYHTEFRHNRIINRLALATELLGNCETIFQEAQQLELEGDFLVAASIYLEILENQDINKYFHELARGKSDQEKIICSSLKEYSHLGLNRIKRKLKFHYTNLLKQADNFYNAKEYENAFLNYMQADSLNQGLSYYARKRMDECKDKIEDNQLGFVKQDINSILGKNFNYPDPQIIRGRTRTFQIDEDRVTLILENDTLSKEGSNSLYISRDYVENEITPSFRSRTFDNRLVESLIEVYHKYSDEIKEIQLNYYGFSDSPLSTQISRKTVRELLGKRTFKDSIKVPEMGYNLTVGELFTNKAFSEANGYRSEELLLAYCRAKYKMNLHKEKYSQFIPDSIIHTGIVPKVILAKGGQYRGVKTEISIKLKAASNSYTIPTEVVEQPDKATLLAFETASQNALKEIATQGLIVDSFNLVPSPYESQIVRDSDQINGLTSLPDLDGDGIISDYDLCPKNFGAIAYNGCPPELDSDDDGIPDYIDMCPAEYGTKSTKGCTKMSLKDIFKQDRKEFEYSRSGLLDISYGMRDFSTYNIFENLENSNFSFFLDQDSILYITQSTDTIGQILRSNLDPDLIDVQKSHYLNIGISGSNAGIALRYKYLETKGFIEHTYTANLGLGFPLAKSRIHIFFTGGAGVSFGKITDNSIEVYPDNIGNFTNNINYQVAYLNLATRIKVFLTRSAYIEGIYDYQVHPEGFSRTDARLRLNVGLQL